MNNEKIDIIKINAKKFLDKNNIAVLSTCSDNVPHGATVYYYINEEYTFYFYTKSETTKARNIRINPNVSLAVGTGPQHISANISGKAFEVTNEDDKQEIFEKLINIGVKNGVKMWPSDDIDKFSGKGNAVFKITPEKITFMNLDSTEYQDSISEEFIQVLP